MSKDRVFSVDWIGLDCIVCRKDEICDAGCAKREGKRRDLYTIASEYTEKNKMK